MKENWSQPGMPPTIVDVLATEVLAEGPEYRLSRHYIRGHHVHLGTPIAGLTGPETVVTREVVRTETGAGLVRVKK
jgi:hypothetical protein